MRTMNGVMRNSLMALVAMTTFAGTAQAGVKHEGSWPDAEKTISIDADNLTRDQAIKRIADAAGWSIVVKAPDRAGAPLALHVKDQSASKILDLVLSDGDYVAKRDGTIVSILPGAAGEDDGDEDIKKNAKSLAASAIAAAASAMNAAQNAEPPEPPTAPAAPAAPVPPVPPIPPAYAHHHSKHHGDADRVVTGGHVTIEKGETVGDVAVLGGSLDVFGDVEGDLSVFGGDSRIHEGGEVHGDAVTLGGSLTVDDGASVDGDVSVIGGSLHRGDKAQIRGSARDDKGELKVSIDNDDDEVKEAPKPHRFVSSVATSMSESALMFVFGAVLLALLTKRVDSLKVEVASRPMRSFALGIVGSIVGVLALIVMCITVVGIPLAIVGVLAAALAIYGSITAVLTTVGQALLAHKTSNPYMHLALGCALLFITASIPVVGGFVVAAVVFTSIGALVATRAAGFVPPRSRQTPTDPYRTAASP
jgi:hypothetical protein